MKRITKRTIVLLGVVAAAVALSVGAYAYWTTSGSGTGSATTGTSAAVTVTQTSTVAALYPGGPAQALNFKITNPGPGAQYIASVAVSIAAIESAPSVPAVGCTTADFTLVQPNAINADLAVGDTAFAPSGASLALNNTASNQDGCKNVTVNLAYAAS